MTASSLTQYMADAATSLPEQIAVGEAVEAVAALHQRDGGATFNLYFGDLAGQELYAVSLYPERTARQQGRSLRRAVLTAFLRRNTDLLRDPRNSVGCWFNDANQATYLDVTTTVPDREEAVRLGIRYNQIAIYGLRQSDVIETAGTGTEIMDLPDETKRLPVMERGNNDVSNSSGKDSDGG